MKPNSVLSSKFHIQNSQTHIQVFSLRRRHLLTCTAFKFASNKKIMTQSTRTSLLDFLAEGFLQQGASVTYSMIGGMAALKVVAEGCPSRLYITAEEEMSKMAFLKRLTSEEIYLPVLRSHDEMRLKAALAKAEIKNIRVYRLSLNQRYAWYSREFINKGISKSASAKSFSGM